MKVLILSVFKGYETDNPANVLKNYLEGHIGNCSAAIIDIFKYTGPMICDFILKNLSHPARTDLKSAYSPKLNNTHGYTADDTAANLEHLIISQLENLVKEYSPDVLVCTHSYYLQLLYSLRRTLFRRIPVLALITDFLLQDSWVYNYVDAYVAANCEMRDKLIEMGVRGDRVFPYGIPVSHRFFLNFSRGFLLDFLGLQDKPTVLLTGMRPYMTVHRKILKYILDSPGDFQIIVAAEDNERFKNQAAQLAKGCKKSVTILERVNMLPEIMVFSSIMISHLSGQVISEAMATGLPFAFHLPCMYRQHAASFIKKGLKIETGNLSIDIEKVLALLGNDTRLKEISSEIRTMVNPYAAQQISDLIISLPGTP